MTVTPHTKDVPGNALNAQVTARSAQMGTLASGSPARYFATIELDRDQQALVVHLMANGRLKASDILSTMT